MEEPSEEWEEYSPPEGSGKVSWILNKGLGLGKMIVISVIVISSAPLVLPPLVVFSAIGLAFSVPFGIFFTSYVCTEKIMSKLLSTPMPSPHSLEHGIFSSDDDEISGDAKEDVGFGEVIDFEKEEERLRKDTEERVEPVKENEGMPKRNNNNGKHDIADGHYSDSVKETTEESYKDEKIAADVDHRVSSGVTESPFGKGTTMASDKAIYSEDKTWENIRALRIILGYKVAPQATRMEELKAL